MARRRLEGGAANRATTQLGNTRLAIHTRTHLPTGHLALPPNLGVAFVAERREVLGDVRVSAVSEVDAVVDVGGDPTTDLAGRLADDLPAPRHPPPLAVVELAVPAGVVATIGLAGVNAATPTNLVRAPVPGQGAGADV